MIIYKINKNYFKILDNGYINIMILLMDIDIKKLVGLKLSI